MKPNEFENRKIRTFKGKQIRKIRCNWIFFLEILSFSEVLDNSNIFLKFEFSLNLYFSSIFEQNFFLF